jgi:hypothetical protein
MKCSFFGSVTPRGNRVTVFWDQQMVKMDRASDDKIATGLLNSLCILPLLSRGSTLPLANLLQNLSTADESSNKSIGGRGLQGEEDDDEDSMFKV